MSLAAFILEPQWAVAWGPSVSVSDRQDRAAAVWRVFRRPDAFYAVMLLCYGSFLTTYIFFHRSYLWRREVRVICQFEFAVITLPWLQQIPGTAVPSHLRCLLRSLVSPQLWTKMLIHHHIELPWYFSVSERFLSAWLDLPGNFPPQFFSIFR